MKKPPPKEEEEKIQYLDHDEDHMADDNRMAEVIERKNGHKVKYLQKENDQLKTLLSDSEKNVTINKNMIDIILGNGNQKGDVMSDKINSELQKENSSLSKSIKDLRKQFDAINTDMLLKN